MTAPTSRRLPLSPEVLKANAYVESYLLDLLDANGVLSVEGDQLVCDATTDPGPGPNMGKLYVATAVSTLTSKATGSIEFHLKQAEDDLDSGGKLIADEEGTNYRLGFVHTGDEAHKGIVVNRKRLDQADHVSELTGSLILAAHRNRLFNTYAFSPLKGTLSI